MGDLATLTAINTNLRLVLSSTIGWNLEDMSDDPDLETTPLVVIDYGNIFFAEDSGEQPKYIELPVILSVIKSELTKVARDLAFFSQVVSIRNNVTVDALNTGDLSVSKLITRVLSGEPGSDQEKNILTTTYPITMRFREEGA